MNSHTKKSAQILANDREWFCKNPGEAVRFRPIQTDEFQLLKSHGVSPPEFKPSWCKLNATLDHVAVVDLTRLLQSKQTAEQPNETIRIRIATIRARSKKNQADLKKELIEAICEELLILHSPAQQSAPKINASSPSTLAA